jgi:hypothetical protein
MQQMAGMEEKVHDAPFTLQTQNLQMHLKGIIEQMIKVVR